MTYDFHSLYIHTDAAETPLAKRVSQRLQGIPREIVSSPPPVQGKATSKNALFITNQRGRIFKACPGTSRYLCCGYRVLNVATGCPLNCTYCILHLYLNQACLTLYANWDKSFHELDESFLRSPRRVIRVGTGELTDSLALDLLTDLSLDLIPLALKRPEVVLELKTKTTAVENLLAIDPCGRVVVSWSVNAEDVIRKDEAGAPPLEKRLQAASRCYEAGYRIGFHFDPLVLHRNWKKGYKRTVEAIFSWLPPESIAWISLGALRYPPEMDTIIRERFPESRLPLEELVPGLDGKLRYFLPLRVEMYRFVAAELRKAAPGAALYLCMESPHVWSASLGMSPRSSADVSRLLDDAAVAGIS